MKEPKSPDEEGSWWCSAYGCTLPGPITGTWGDVMRHCAEEHPGTWGVLVLPAKAPDKEG